MEFPNLYKGDYRLLAIPPVALILLSLFLLPQVKLGVEFTGGTLVTFVSSQPIESADINAVLLEQGLHGDTKVFPTSRGYQVEILLPQDARFTQIEQLKENFSLRADDVEQAAYQATVDPAQKPAYLQKRAELNAIADSMFAQAQSGRKAAELETVSALRTEFLQAYTRVYDNYRQAVTAPLTARFTVSSLSLQTVSPTLSVHFLSTATNVVVASALLSVLLVFLFFRTFVPSLAVITGAFSDIAIALGAMAFFGIPLTLASFAALLMLIGFSLDTDILLTSRILKRKGSPRDNAYDAMKTGTTMSVTALIAFGVLFLLSVVTHIPTYFEISSVALAGLVADLLATWGINAVLLLAYVERKTHAG